MQGRRSALKFTLSLVAAALLTPLYANEEKRSRVVIVGAGSAGLSLLNTLAKNMPSLELILVAPNTKHIYQPGQVFVGAGVYGIDEILRNTKEFVPKNVTWIKEKLLNFKPDANTITTQSGKNIAYDYLIVAMGVSYHYESIKGLKREEIGSKNIASVYLNDTIQGTLKGATGTWEWFQALKRESKKREQKVLFSMPNTPVKCGAVAQKMMYLSSEYLQKDGLKMNAIYTPNGGRLFGLSGVNKELMQAQKNYKITNKFHHNLIEIDTQKKIATYQHNYEIKKDWDEDFEEWGSIEKATEIVKMEYDLIHIVPPMSAPKAVTESVLAKKDGHAKGWLDVDRETLRHKRFINIFGIGDVCGIPLGKTVPTALAQTKIILKNLQDSLLKRKLSAKFDGYSVCPIKISYTEAILAEFDYTGLTYKISTKRDNKPSKEWYIYDRDETKENYWSKGLRGLL